MKVIIEPPPIIEKVVSVFGDGVRSAIFCWGDTIFNPSGCTITPALLAHEETHSIRQGIEVEAWWDRYLTDPQFRLDEEIPAHIAEFKEFCKGKNLTRNLRRNYLKVISQRLSSPLYGRLVTFEVARSLIKQGAKAHG